MNAGYYLKFIRPFYKATESFKAFKHHSRLFILKRSFAAPFFIARVGEMIYSHNLIVLNRD